MKENQEPSLTPIDTIAGRNGLQIIKALLPYLNRPVQMPLAFLIKFLEMQNLRLFFQESGAIRAQNINSGSYPDMLSEILPYFPVGVREQLNQGLQMMETLRSVQELNTGYDNFDFIQSMFSQSDSEKEI